MKNLFAAAILVTVLAGLSFAQTSSRAAAGRNDRSARIRIAVVEFTPGPNAAAMTAEAKRQLQASIAFSLTQSKAFDVVDVRNTRAASQSDLAAINGTSTAAAVRVGKQMGVSYVLTGIVAEYNTAGSATLKARLVEVATGKVRYAGETLQQATSAMRSTGAAEMQTKVMKPAIERLTEALISVF